MYNSPLDTKILRKKYMKPGDNSVFSYNKINIFY